MTLIIQLPNHQFCTSPEMELLMQNGVLYFMKDKKNASRSNGFYNLAKEVHDIRVA